MPINYKKRVAVLKGYCEIEDAETLLGWLLEHPKGQLNLKQCTHPHTAVLQVMMALHPTISAGPEDETAAAWFEPLITDDD